MQLVYGTYAFPANGVEIVDRTEICWNEGGQATSFRRMLDVIGYLYGPQLGSTQADITLQMSVLQNVLSVQGQDLVFFQDDGTASATALRNANSISGVRITKGPDFPENKGNEYVNQRKFTFSAYAEYPYEGTDQFLTSWRESLTFSGGGQLYAYMPNLYGDWQPQLIYPAMSYKMVQSGEAHGYRDYPTPPNPFYQPPILIKTPNVRLISPNRQSVGQYERFGITWEYHYESVTPIVALPNLWYGETP